MKKIFIIGPFRSEDHFSLHQNCIAAERISALIWYFEAIAYCPHLQTRHLLGHVNDEVIREGHLAMLSLCDGAVVLPNIINSEGSLDEIEQADSEAQPLLYLPSTWETQWLRSYGELKQFIDNLTERTHLSCPSVKQS